MMTVLNGGAVSNLTVSIGDELIVSSKAQEQSRLSVRGAGLSLSLMSGASAAATDVPTRNTGVNHEITLSVMRKSLTSAWRRFMSLTSKMPEHFGVASSLQPVAVAAVMVKG
jgi:hypothetical protein